MTELSLEFMHSVAWSSNHYTISQCFIRCKDLFDGKVQCNDTQIAERQNFFVIYSPKREKAARQGHRGDCTREQGNSKLEL